MIYFIEDLYKTHRVITIPKKFIRRAKILKLYVMIYTKL